MAGSGTGQHKDFMYLWRAHYGIHINERDAIWTPLKRTFYSAHPNYTPTK